MKMVRKWKRKGRRTTSLFIFEPSKVTQRTKKDSITVESYLSFETIKLKVVAEPEDWIRLAFYTCPEDFGEEFFPPLCFLL